MLVLRLCFKTSGLFIKDSHFSNCSPNLFLSESNFYSAMKMVDTYHLLIRQLAEGVSILHRLLLRQFWPNISECVILQLFCLCWHYFKKDSANHLFWQANQDEIFLKTIMTADKLLVYGILLTVNEWRINKAEESIFNFIQVNHQNQLKNNVLLGLSVLRIIYTIYSLLRPWHSTSL